MKDLILTISMIMIMAHGISFTADARAEVIKAMDTPQAVEMVQPAPQQRRKSRKEVTWWCGRCGKGYTNDTPKGECPKCKHVPVVTCECGFQYYKYDINGNKVTCPECELKAWEEAQKQKEKKVEKPTVEAPAQPEPVELTPNELYDLEIENGEYCEAREHYTDGEHDTGTGCKTEEQEGAER